MHHIGCDEFDDSTKKEGVPTSCVDRQTTCEDVFDPSVLGTLLQFILGFGNSQDLRLQSTSIHLPMD